jgi:hypothetical protein
MQSELSILRARFLECRRDTAPLEMWRELQIALLAAARAHAGNTIANANVWRMLGESFWYEEDPRRIAAMMEDLIATLEATSPHS